MLPETRRHPFSEPLPIYVIYHGTSDYGQMYVVRQWGIYDQANMFIHAPRNVTHTLEAARRSLPGGLFCLGRNPGDDPVIVESWI